MNLMMPELKRNTAGRLALCGVLLALPAFALAEDAAVDAHKLGVDERVLQFCEPVDPAAAAKLREKIKTLEHGASEPALATIRRSPEYQKAFDAESNFLSNVDTRNAKRVCTIAQKP